MTGERPQVAVVVHGKMIGDGDSFIGGYDVVVFDSEGKIDQAASVEASQEFRENENWHTETKLVVVGGVKPSVRWNVPNKSLAFEFGPQAVAPREPTPKRDMTPKELAALAEFRRTRHKLLKRKLQNRKHPQPPRPQ